MYKRLKYIPTYSLPIWDILLSIYTKRNILNSSPSKSSILAEVVDSTVIPICITARGSGHVHNMSCYSCISATITTGGRHLLARSCLTSVLHYNGLHTDIICTKLHYTYIVYNASNSLDCNMHVVVGNSIQLLKFIF